jgi:PAS domain S-box-containing protein
VNESLRDAAPGASAIASSVRTDRASSDPVAILIVDDNHANLVALRALLEPLGEEVVMASSGEEALRAVLHREFAVILMDVQMPGLDGFETAAMIKARARSRHVPIVFLTAINRDSHHVFRGYAEGAVDYIVKPFDPEVLRSKVSVFVDLSRKERMIREQAELLRRRDLEALAARDEARYHALMDALPHGVWAIARDGMVQYANAVALELGARGTIAREVFERLVHESDRANAITTWIHALRSRAPAETQIRIRVSDGSVRWHLARVAPQHEPGDDRDAVTGWLVTITDVEEQKRGESIRMQLLEQERAARCEAEEARRDAVAANRTKDEFLATVSHELRTPLTAILGWAHVLRGNSLDSARAARAIETIERNALVQAQLVDDILDVSRIVAGKLRVDLAPVALASIAEVAIDSVRPSADSKGVHLDADLDAGVSAMADPDRLQQVIWNLLSNAIKFTPPGGTIRVSLFAEDGRAVVRVRDDGEGIPADFLPHVFEPFRQSDGSSTRSHGGLGLGLSIVRHLVRLHGGEVSAASDGAGRGATFDVRIPSCDVRATADDVTPCDGSRVAMVDTPRVVVDASRHDEHAAPSADGSSRRRASALLRVVSGRGR